MGQRLRRVTDSENKGTATQREGGDLEKGQSQRSQGRDGRTNIQRKGRKTDTKRHRDGSRGGREGDTNQPPHLQREAAGQGLSSGKKTAAPDPPPRLPQVPPPPAAAASPASAPVARRLGPPAGRGKNAPGQSV